MRVVARGSEVNVDGVLMSVDKAEELARELAKSIEKAQRAIIEGSLHIGRCAGRSDIFIVHNDDWWRLPATGEQVTHASAQYWRDEYGYSFTKVRTPTSLKGTVL